MWGWRIGLKCRICIVQNIIYNMNLMITATVHILNIICIYLFICYVCIFKMNNFEFILPAKKYPLTLYKTNLWCIILIRDIRDMFGHCHFTLISLPTAYTMKATQYFVFIQLHQFQMHSKYVSISFEFCVVFSVYGLLLLMSMAL